MGLNQYSGKKRTFGNARLDYIESIIQVRVEQPAALSEYE